MQKKRGNWHKYPQVNQMDPFQKAFITLLIIFITLFAISELNFLKSDQSSVKHKEIKNQQKNDSTTIPQQETPPFDLHDIEDEDQNEKTQETDQLSDLLVLNSDLYNDLRLIQADIEQFIRDNELVEVVSTKLTIEGLHVLLYTDTLFEVGYANFEINGQQLIKSIAQYIRVDQNNEIIVIGHADDFSAEKSVLASNWELSAMRAMQVMQVLTENIDLKKSQFSARARGDEDPYVANTTKSNNHLNRRVEVIVQPRI